MAKSPAFQFYPKDWQTDEKVMLMTLEQEGAYMRLLGHQWLHGTIPADIESLARICRADDETMARIWEKVGPCFVEAEDGRLYNERMERQRQDLADFSEKKSEAGKKGAKKRWRKHGSANGNPNGDPNGGATDSPMAENGSAVSSLQSPSSSPPPTPLPPNAGGGGVGSPETDKEAKDGTDTTATMIGQHVNNLWRELGLGSSRGYDWNLGAMKITALTEHFTDEEILSGVRKIARTPGLAWAGKRGPSYLATKNAEGTWRLEIVLTWEDARRGAEAGSSGQQHESAAERAKRLVGART